MMAGTTIRQIFLLLCVLAFVACAAKLAPPADTNPALGRGSGREDKVRRWTASVLDPSVYNSP